MNSPPAQLAAAVALRFGWDFEPDLLAHRPHGRLSGAGALDTRRNLIENAYSATRRSRNQRFLIVDDFATGGTTMREICQALSAVHGELKALGFALAKTEKQRWADRYNITLQNDHLPAGLVAEWDAA